MVPSGSLTINLSSQTSCRPVLVIWVTLYFFILAAVSHLVTGSRPLPMTGRKSTIVQSAPRSVMNSMTSRPTAPPPMMTIFLPVMSAG